MFTHVNIVIDAVYIYSKCLQK